MASGLVFSDIYLEHFTGRHPENRLRLENTVRHFKDTGLWDRFVHVEPRAADVSEIAWVHSQDMIKYAKRLADKGGGYADMDTPISAASFKAALYAAGGLFEAADRIMAGGINNALCLVRPPGHHATPQASMGFCIFNNVALAAVYLRKKHGIERVAIVDFDVHHGNGTQDIFYSDPSVLFFSMHRYPFYPGSGAAYEEGEGTGKGYTVNVPLEDGVTASQYMEHFDRVIETRVKPFKPEFILVSAGFDAYVLDPLGAFCLEEDEYRAMTLKIKAVAADCCSGRIISTLEGGYNLEQLPLLIAAHAEALL